MSVNRLYRAIVSGLATLAFIITPVVAQVGHSPFQATPAATGGTGWQIDAVTPLDIDGNAIAISPDGATIAGLGPDREFCFWTVEDLGKTCPEPPPGRPLDIDPDSIAWAPDSSAVAFSVLAYRFLIDGDIYVAGRDDSAIRNVTDDGIEDADFFGDDAEPVPMDVMPAWTPDSASIVFSRTVFDDRDEYSNEIMRVARDGDDPETLLSLPELPASIFLPMRVLTDGSILYTVGFSDQDEPTNGLWLLSPDGDATKLMPGTAGSDFPVPMVNDVREGDGEIRILGHSPLLLAQYGSSEPFAFVWSSETGEAVPLEPAANQSGSAVYPGAISPDGGTLLSLERGAGELPQVTLQGPVSSVAVLPEFGAEVMPGGRPIYRIASWSDANLALISPYLTDGAYLVSVEPVSPGVT